jgi:large repetitive protein
MSKHERIWSRRRSVGELIKSSLRRIGTSARGVPPGSSTKACLKESVSRRVLIEALEPRLLLSADLLPIQGTIDVPGEVDRYAFTLSEPKQVLFDAEKSDSRLNWSLAGPRGTEVSSQSFSNQDSLLTLISGEYTLSVAGSTDATGNYQFRLLDLANGIGITPGTPISGALDPGSETSASSTIRA